MANTKKWKEALKDLIFNPWENEGDSDHPSCPICGATMNFHGHDESGDFPLGEGHWDCPSCGHSVKENEVY